MSDDFIAGWKAARAYWSANHGSLPPYPPQPAEKLAGPPQGSVGEPVEPDNEE